MAARSAVVLLALGALSALEVPSGFLPEMDEGAFVLDYFLPAGTSLHDTDEAARKIEAILAATPEVASYSRRTGAELGPAAATEVSRGDIMVRLKGGRRRAGEDVIADVRARVAAEVQQDLVHAGWLGRKSGRGFYDYCEGSVRAHADALPAGPRPQQVRIEGSLGAAAALVDRLRRVDGLGVEVADGAGLLRVNGVALALTHGRTAAERAVTLGEPVVLFDLALDYATCGRVALACSETSDHSALACAAGFFASLGIQASLVADLPGLLVMRTVAMLVNEAAEAVHQGVAAEDSVDAAMCKGVNYPLGPLAWGRRIGFASALRVMRNLRAAYGEDRYRASMWLQQQAGGAA